MLKYRKKEILTIAFILIFALVSTHHIYYKFENSRGVNYNSDTLDVKFHEDDGDEVNILKVVPVTDSVGLSSKAYTFTISNDTNKTLKYSIYLQDNLKKQEMDNCGEYKIPKNVIRFSIHKDNEENSIYNLGDLVNGRIVTRTIKAKHKDNYTLRFWVTDNNIARGVKLHYHGLIHVEDEGVNIAAAIK